MTRETKWLSIAVIGLGIALALQSWDSAGRPQTVSAQSGSTLQPGGKVTVTTAGTRVQLTSTVTRANGIYIEADEDNSGVIFIGASTVTGDSYVSRLTAGQGWSWTIEPGGPMVNPSSVYIDSDTNSHSVQWGYY